MAKKHTTEEQEGEFRSGFVLGFLLGQVVTILSFLFGILLRRGFP